MVLHCLFMSAQSGAGAFSLLLVPLLGCIYTEDVRCQTAFVWGWAACVWVLCHELSQVESEQLTRGGDRSWICPLAKYASCLWNAHAHGRENLLDSVNKKVFWGFNAAESKFACSASEEVGMTVWTSGFSITGDQQQQHKIFHLTCIQQIRFKPVFWKLDCRTLC